MLKTRITKPLREHCAEYFVPPEPPAAPQGKPVVYENVLFEEFSEMTEPQSREALPEVLFQELRIDTEHVVKQIASAAMSRQERLTLSRSRVRQIDNQLHSVEAYLSRIAHWAPGYNSGMDSLRNSLASARTRLEQEKHIEQVKCLEDCSRIQQSLLDLIREYERLKTDLGLLLGVKEGAP